MIATFTRSKSILARCAVALAAVGLATLLKLVAGRWLSEDAEMVFFAAVAFAAWYGGARAGMVATFLAALSQWYFFIAPKLSFAWPDPMCAAQLVGWVLESLLLCALWGAVSRGHQREASRVVALAKAEAAVRAERDQRAFFEATPVPMFIFETATRRFVAVNDAALRLYRHTRSEFLALGLADLVPAGTDAAIASHELDGTDAVTATHRKRDGSVVHVELTPRAIGQTMRSVAVIDVTANRRLEEQLRHAQKMDAVGRLAGGIAHDFNNALSVILGYTDMLLDDVAPGDPKHADLCEMRTAGQQAAALTRQLLLFSRQQVLEPRVLDLNEVVGRVAKILPRLLGEDIELVSKAGADLGLVKVDPGHVEQVIMNLAVNARDAMRGGGKLVFETRNVVLEEAEALVLHLKPGRHVQLIVRDDGIGMDAATQAHIFEPFFTTKGIGHGTGLGLSTVFGIVQESKGCIRVESERGVGTTFYVYLPITHDARTARPDAPPKSGRKRAGSETILVVEDEDQVRAVVRSILKRRGYDVIEARSGAEALEVCASSGDEIDLLLSDVIMPQMSGTELVQRVMQTHPKMKVICMSGYTEKAGRDGIERSGTPFLQKPFTPDALARKVRAVLDGSRVVAKRAIVEECVSLLSA